MNARNRPHVREVLDQSGQDHVSTRRNQGETLTDAMRRVTEEAREEISRIVKHEAEKSSSN